MAIGSRGNLDQLDPMVLQLLLRLMQEEPQQMAVGASMAKPSDMLGLGGSMGGPGPLAGPPDASASAPMPGQDPRDTISSMLSSQETPAAAPSRGPMFGPPGQGMLGGSAPYVMGGVGGGLPNMPELPGAPFMFQDGPEKIFAARPPQLAEERMLGLEQTSLNGGQIPAPPPQSTSSLGMPPGVSVLPPASPTSLLGPGGASGPLSGANLPQGASVSSHPGGAAPVSAQARTTAELPFETFQRLTGMDWTGGKSDPVKQMLEAFGITDQAGTASANMALQKKLRENAANVGNATLPTEEDISF